MTPGDLARQHNAALAYMRAKEFECERCGERHKDQEECGCCGMWQIDEWGGRCDQPCG
jgi:ribosomal protein S27AE